MISPHEFFARQKDILEKLFPKGWFEEKPRFNHPAYNRWKLCDDIIHQNCEIKSPEQDHQLTELGKILLDTCGLVSLTGGNAETLMMGDLDLYGDGKVQSMIRSRIANEDQFEDVMLELTTAAPHVSNRYSVTPMEIEGYPDFRIDMPQLDVPVFGECKCLRSVSANKINKVIEKANSQLKAVGIPSFGVVYLDINLAVDIGIVPNSDIPPIVADVKEKVIAALRGPKNRSVGAVILMWNYAILHSQIPGKSTVAFIRNFIRVPHSPESGVREIPEECNLYAAYVVFYGINWKPRNTSVTSSYHSFYNF